MTEVLDGADVYRLPLERRLLAPFLDRRAREDGHRPYLTVEGRTYTFGETARICRAVARGLAAQGVGNGDYLAMMLPNCAEFVFAWYGCALRNTAFVPINPQYRGFLFASPLRETKSRGIVIHRELFGALDSLEPADLEHVEWIAVVGGAAGLSLADGRIRLLDFEALLIEEGDAPEAPATFRDIHSVMYTSGTTGPSKGVLISNGQFFSSACVFLRSVALAHDDVLFTPFPLFHGLASRLGVLPALMVGAHVVVGGRFSGSRYFQQAAECGATVGHVLFTMPPILKAHPPSPYDRGHRLTRMYNAHHDPEFEERFGVRLCEAYGMTETGLVMFSDYPDRKLGSTGRIHEDFEVQLVDDNDLPVAAGQPGEIVLRPKKPFIMMQGYLDKPADTIRAWRNLWFHTGDIARQDEEGFFYFVDRVKERIRRRGENISSWDVEHYVGAHPAVAACAALGHPAPGGEDDVRVVVVLKPGMDVTAAELSAWLATRMPRFMQPRYLEFVAELPLSPTAKVEKYKLAAQGLGPTAWDRDAVETEAADA